MIQKTTQGPKNNKETLLVNPVTSVENQTRLEHAHLKKFVAELPERMNHECGEGGGNLRYTNHMIQTKLIVFKSNFVCLEPSVAEVFC
jgi:hypothetical protein